MIDDISLMVIEQMNNENGHDEDWEPDGQRVEDDLTENVRIQEDLKEYVRGWLRTSMEKISLSKELKSKRILLSIEKYFLFFPMKEIERRSFLVDENDWHWMHVVQFSFSYFLY